MFIILAILAFGIIIAIHELGHYLAAKAFGVKVKEFAIGMGPKLFAKQGKETLYSLRALPFGGFCDMEGEHEAGGEPDPRSFLNQKRWRRIIILAAGSVANVILAFIIVLILTAGAQGFIGTTVTDMYDRFPDQGPPAIMNGDRVVAVNDERLFYYDDFHMFLTLYNDRPITLTLERDGELIFHERQPYIIDGVEQFRYHLPPSAFNFIENNVWETIRYSGYQMFSFARMIRVSISMMIGGTAGVGDMAGVVGIVDVMNTVGQEAETAGAGILSIIYFAAFIAVNVGIINMLPIPAMDGGRILFIFVTFVIEKVTRKTLDPKYEGYINTGAFVLLLGLMAFLFYNDIARIVQRIIAN